MQVPSENLDGIGRIESEELGFGASEAPFELRALEIALDVVRTQPAMRLTYPLQELAWRRTGNVYLEL